jgi:zinc transport system ATP-binding protein
MTDSTPAILVQNLTFTYGGPPVLQDVNLTIEGAHLTCIVGPNGGGKTTLLKIILGLLRPDSGTVRVFGESPVRARKRIGYTPQHLQFDPKFPISVMDVVLMGRLGRRLGGAFTRGDRAAAQEALESLGLLEHASELFSDLSGGLRQRVLIARSLASKPELLLLDEPMANVDAVVEARLAEILRRLAAQLPVVMVSHDLGFVSNVVDSVICVNRKVVIHPTSEITGEVIRDIYESDIRMVRHDHRCAESGHEIKG